MQTFFAGFKSAASCLLLLLLIASSCQAQENAKKILSPTLVDCYENPDLQKWNLLPQDLSNLIAIVRKLENAPGFTLGLRDFAGALLHRFRQDGIVKSPTIHTQSGVLPYAPMGMHFRRHAKTLQVVAGTAAANLDINSITPLEKCSLHAMISSSIAKYARYDESRDCQRPSNSYQSSYNSRPYNSRRYRRGLSKSSDVETLSTEQMKALKAKNENVDPDSLYPDLPPNHPLTRNGRYAQSEPQLSNCPIENGVVKTPYGSVAGGPLLAGIAAGLQPQTVPVSQLLRARLDDSSSTGPMITSYASELPIENRFLATLAGDLAEVALMQGPRLPNLPQGYRIGTEGHWNSSQLPRFYFLEANEDLQMTAAEIRGDLDGLGLAERVMDQHNRFPSLKLSQILDMYYSERGFFDPNLRACNRNSLAQKLTQEKLVEQAYSAAVVLSPELATAFITSEKIQELVAQAVKDLQAFIPKMPPTPCETDGKNPSADPRRSPILETAVDVTVIVDSSWPFDQLSSILAQLLGQLDISPFSGNFSIVNGADGKILVESSNVITDLLLFNRTIYDRLTNRGFDMSTTLRSLRNIQNDKLNEERRVGRAGGQSDIALFLTYQTRPSQQDKDYQMKTLKEMHERAPDALALFLTAGAKSRWEDYVLDKRDDLFEVPTSFAGNDQISLDGLVARIKRQPRRLINTRCGADYDETMSNGPSKSLTAHVGPNGQHIYRMHPNYFMSDNSKEPPTVIVKGVDSAVPLEICSARSLEALNQTQGMDRPNCEMNTHITRLSCDGASYLHECQPFYLSVRPKDFGSTNRNYACKDCRFPDDLTYTVNFEKLVCKSSAGRALLLSPLLLVILLARIFS